MPSEYAGENPPHRVDDEVRDSCLNTCMLNTRSVTLAEGWNI